MLFSQLTQKPKDYLNGRSFLLSAAAITLLLAFTYSAATWALSSPQDPTTETIIAVDQDGIEATDATTSTPAGTDSSDSNGVVKNFDLVVYEVEASLNDADDTNFTTTVTLNNSASWTEVPADCRVQADFPGISPDSSVTDTTGNGLNDTLICNHGDQTEGTKVLFKPAAQATGNNLDTITVNATSNSDNPAATHRAADSLDTTITASFGVSLDKTILSLPEVDEINYRPVYEPASVHGEEGKTVNWHIALSHNTGSEFIEDNGGGTQDFTITDTWVGTHSNDPTVEGDNANGNFNDAIVLKSTITGNAADGCSLLDQPATSIATVTCTQNGPGEPITIQVNDTPVNQATLAKVSLNMFYPYDDIFDPNGFATAETYNIDNTAELTAWGGAGTLVTSQTGTVDSGPEVSVKDWLISATRPGSLNFTKTFDDNGVSKTGQRAAVPGEIVETSLGINDQRLYSTNPAVCDTLDINSFVYAGYIGTGQQDAYLHGGPISFGTSDNLRANAIHSQFNPLVVTDDAGSAVNVIASATAFDALQQGVTIEFSDVDYVATGDDHWTATCEDDLTGDGNSDWVTDTSLIGGDANVVRIRMSWDRDWNALYAQSDPLALNSRLWFSFNLQLLNTVSVGSYLPNAATTYDEDNNNWGGTWLNNIGGTRANGNAWTAGYVNVETDPTNALYSFNSLNADRVLVLPASQSITKTNNPTTQGPVEPGDTVSFTIDPRTNGTASGTHTMTFTDVLPAELSYASDTCASVYAAASLSCTAAVSGQTITFTVPNYTIGDDLPAFTIDATVNPGVASGMYTNDVEISSSLALLSDDSHCATATDVNGNSNTADCEDVFAAPHSDAARVVVVASAGESVTKQDIDQVLEPQSDYVTTLEYTNLGASDIGIGHLIDVLPYNGDGALAVPGTATANSPERFNGQNPGNANTGTDTADQDGRIEFVSIAPSSAGETFEYTTTASASVDHRPCHPSNWPAGDALGGANATLNAICSEGLVDPATDVPTAAQAGTGTTTWSTTAPADPSDVTAVRASLPAFSAGQPTRTLTLTMNTGFAQEGNLFCNNFGLNSDIITLDIISNDVCVEIVDGSIGDYVWLDSDGDGTQDANELPLAGVTIKLLDNSGADILGEDGQPLTATTNASGNYTFSNLPSGDYIVMVDTTTLPAGLTQTYDSDGAGDDMSATTLTFDGTDVSDDFDQDFGYQGLASVGDYLWIDTNNDGIQDATEQPLVGVTVKLLDASGNPVTDALGSDITDVTDGSGLYLFDNLPYDDYTVMVDTATLPTGYGQTYDNDGGLDNMSVTTLDATNSNDLDQDFGYVELGSISGRAWVDPDLDFSLDGSELTLSGLTVTLHDAAGNVVTTTTTDDNGEYSFGNLFPGDYSVQISPPEGFDPANDVDGLGNLFEIQTVTVVAGATTPEQNFTFVQDGSTNLAETGQEIFVPLLAGMAILLIGVGVRYRVHK